MTQYFHYAGFWRRAVALFIDMFIFNILIGILAVIFITAFDGMGAATGQQEVFDGIGAGGFLLLVFVGPYIWFAAFESSSWQATPGKRALSLKVTSEEGNRISFLNAFGRNIGKIVSGMIFMIGYMMAGWTRRKQALHDLMAGCLVIRRIN